ncbi:B3 domain-containing protein [Cardamine amara subsp. amara]|uniref:B3 domain-containing protein n=1 Tax=Cardamine amara subsp. amara TaxID=228776 RepID=A0ABD0ZMT2_CARAN
MALNNGFGQFQASFFKVLQRVDLYSENMRALPHDFVRNFSDEELSLEMKIGAEWGSSWDIGISKNPRFCYMEKSGWEKFVRDNALGDNEFVTFTHIRKMYFTVNIYNQNCKEMLQPPQSRASSSRVKTEQEEIKVTTPAELSHRGATTPPAESSGGGKDKRKLNFGKKRAEESQTSKRTEKMVKARRYSPGASSSSVADIIIFIKKSYLNILRFPNHVSNDLMPRERTMFIIHHPDKKRSWNVVYLPRAKDACLSGGWARVAKEYSIAVGDTCSFTSIKPNELILVVSKP